MLNTVWRIAELLRKRSGQSSNEKKQRPQKNKRMFHYGIGFLLEIAMNKEVDDATGYGAKLPAD